MFILYNIKIHFYTDNKEFKEKSLILANLFLSFHLFAKIIKLVMIINQFTF